MVLRRVPKTADWHPGVPDLTLKSWLKFKQAAATRAYPRLAKDSCLTPEADSALEGFAPSVQRRSVRVPRGARCRDGRRSGALAGFSDEVRSQLEALIAALRAYRPKTSEPENPQDQKWAAGMPHHEMEAVADAMTAQAELILRDVKLDL